MLKFTVRELFLLTLAAAVGAGWYISEREAAAEQRQAARKTHVLLLKEEKRREEIERLVHQHFSDKETWESRANVLVEQVERDLWTVEWRPEAVYLKRPGEKVGQTYDFDPFIPCGQAFVDE
jgi:hypothetical protein